MFRQQFYRITYLHLKKYEAYDIQLAMLEKELKGGAKQIGWKLGGTTTGLATKKEETIFNKLKIMKCTEEGIHGESL